MKMPIPRDFTKTMSRKTCRFCGEHTEVKGGTNKNRVFRCADCVAIKLTKQEQNLTTHPEAKP